MSDAKVPAPGSYAAHVERLARAHGDRPALFAGRSPPLAWSALDASIVATRATLAQAGVGAGDIVAWPTADRAASAAALAIVPGACTIAPLDPALSEAAAATLLARLRPAAVVVPTEREHVIARAAAALGIATLDLEPEPGGTAGAFRLVPRSRGSARAAPRRVDPDTLAVTCTSGSTGRPKLVPHGWRSITIASRAIGERLAITRDDVSAHMTPLFLANGLRNAFMLAIVHGAAVRVLPEADAAAFLDAVEAGEVTYTSASFAIQREVLRRLESGHRVEPRRLRFVRVASGAMAGDEMDRLERALGVPVLSGLSSSETGTVALQRLPPAPRPRGACGPPLDAALRIVGDDGQDVAPGGEGEIRVRGPQVFAGYLDDPGLDAASFVDGWFSLGDRGRIDADGELRVTGRTSEMINRGGEKVSPLEIDAALRAWPGVAEAAAFALPHRRLGQEVGAAVVPAADAELDVEGMLAELRARLGPRRAPKRLWIVDALPRAGNGKLARQRLPAQVGWTDAGDVADGGSASPVEAAVARLWASVLGVDPPPRELSFAELGGDAAKGAALRAELRAVFAVDLPPDALDLERARLPDLARALDAAIEARRTDG